MKGEGEKETSMRKRNINQLTPKGHPPTPRISGMYPDGELNRDLSGHGTTHN